MPGKDARERVQVEPLGRADDQDLEVRVWLSRAAPAAPLFMVGGRGGLHPSGSVSEWLIASKGRGGGTSRPRAPSYGRGNQLGLRELLFGLIIPDYFFSPFLVLVYGETSRIADVPRFIIPQMAWPKVPKPREYDFNEADRAAFRTRFWRCPVRLVEDGTWAAMWSGGGRRRRGGGAAGALLPVLALHVWPGQEGAVPGWTGAAGLSYRRLARLAGLDKDTVATALADLVALDLVWVEYEKVAERDVRKLALVRLTVRAYASSGERHAVFPASFVYGGGWSRVPGMAARHLLVAWAAWARGRIADPAAGALPRTMLALVEALARASGMGKTAVRESVAALAAWRTPDGATLVQRPGGFLRPDLQGVAARYKWPLLAGPGGGSGPVEEAPATGESGGGAERVGDGVSEDQAPAESDDGAGPLGAGNEAGEGADAGIATTKPRGGRMRRSTRKAEPGGEPIKEFAPELPPLEGAEAVEARKAWFIRRYLGRWANRVLRRSWEPVKQAVFVDLAPGVCEEGLPPALQAAAEIARGMRRSPRRAPPLMIVVVEPDPDRARRLRLAWAPFDVLSVTGSSSALALARYAGGEGPRAMLVFAGAIEDELLFRNDLFAMPGTREREVVAFSRAGSADSRQGRLWRLPAGVRAEEQGEVVRFARAAFSAGARTVLSTPLVAQDGAATGVIVHAGSSRAALPAWKSGLFAAQRRGPSGSQPEFSGRSFVASADVATALAKAFPGRPLRWSDSDNPGPTVRAYALNRTACLPSELGMLRRELVERGWRDSQRPLAFAVPDLGR